jgi:hypothetical protein
MRSNDVNLHTNTVKPMDQLPEYKLFGSNTPSIHTLLFGSNENIQKRSSSHHVPLSNGLNHDVDDIEKRLLGIHEETNSIVVQHMIYIMFSFQETDLGNNYHPTSFLPAQESDELGKCICR